MRKASSFIVGAFCAVMTVAVAAASWQQPANMDRAMTAPAMRNDLACTFKQDMRKLWTDHVVWTRNYIIAAVDDKPDAKAAADRLMKNQDDIGAAVAKFYGVDAGNKLTALLK